MIPPPDLASLEADVTRALSTGDVAALRILGYGEISLVLGFPRDTPQRACKRLPPFPSAVAADAYATTLADYLTELHQRGIHVVDTAVQRVDLVDGRVAVYCVQPVVPAEELAIEVVRRGDGSADRLIADIVDSVFGAVDARLGLDAQLSNWAVTDGALTYFDITTPLLRRADGSEALDTDLFLASLPWLLRPPVRRFVVPGIIERYHRPRTVVLDLAANLIKEHLEEHIVTVLEAAGDRLDPPLTVDEVRADYRSDARTWALLQSLRRADRVWQRRIRRRASPFLLPERIER